VTNSDMYNVINMSHI